MVTKPNIALLIMFVIGIILATVGISMTVSDIIDADTHTLGETHTHTQNLNDTHT